MSSGRRARGLDDVVGGVVVESLVLVEGRQKMRGARGRPGFAPVATDLYRPLPLARLRLTASAWQARHHDDRRPSYDRPGKSLAGFLSPHLRHTLEESSSSSSPQDSAAARRACLSVSGSSLH